MLQRFNYNVSRFENKLLLNVPVVHVEAAVFTLHRLVAFESSIELLYERAPFF